MKNSNKSDEDLPDCFPLVGGKYRYNSNKTKQRKTKQRKTKHQKKGTTKRTRRSVRR